MEKYDPNDTTLQPQLDQRKPIGLYQKADSPIVKCLCYVLLGGSYVFFTGIFAMLGAAFGAATFVIAVDGASHISPFKSLAHRIQRLSIDSIFKGFIGLSSLFSIHSIIIDFLSPHKHGYLRVWAPCYEEQGNCGSIWGDLTLTASTTFPGLFRLIEAMAQGIKPNETQVKQIANGFFLHNWHWLGPYKWCEKKKDEEYFVPQRKEVKTQAGSTFLSPYDSVNRVRLNELMYSKALSKKLDVEIAYLRLVKWKLEKANALQVTMGVHQWTSFWYQTGKLKSPEETLKTWCQIDESDRKKHAETICTLIEESGSIDNYFGNNIRFTEKNQLFVMAGSPGGLIVNSDDDQITQEPGNKPLFRQRAALIGLHLLKNQIDQLKNQSNAFESFAKIIDQRIQRLDSGWWKWREWHWQKFPHITWMTVAETMRPTR